MLLTSSPHDIAAASQRLAASPHHSAWVAASAGSGKTKVLVDRVLNLLLEGCPPERLLCLTFTKAAAAEMANRLRTRLGEWAILPLSALKVSLEELCEGEISADKVTRARELFSLTIDAPGGLKIQTIHSFCQSLLKRFPLEAGLSPFFTVMEERDQKNLIQQAFYSVIESPLFAELILRFGSSTFEELNTFILQKREAISEKIPPLPPERKKELSIPEEELRKFLPLFQKGSVTDQTRGEDLAAFLSLSEEEREACFEDYTSLFLTQQGEKRVRLLTQKLATDSPALQQFLEREALRLEAWAKQKNADDIMRVSHFLALYSHAFLKAYTALKAEESLLDYEDLILKTVNLLKDPGCHWVLYKLDGGLDHILVDEAQDTSPSQWQVIRAIAEEFYANAAADTRNRTLFIVGDSKQSIYSFQGVDPSIFSQMQRDLHTFAQNSGKRWENVDLNVSFRSTPEILDLVKAVFPAFPPHLSFRKDAPGHVEIWPLIKDEEDSALEPWQPPMMTVSKASPQQRLALKIASTLRTWLGGRGGLARPVTPGDILILVRRRTTFVETLVRALKEAGIPVAGIDRLWLQNSLGVKDLIKIGEFLLLPEDDLTLATLLKCPLFSFSEEDLFSLSYNRGTTSLWDRLKSDERFKEAVGLLEDLLAKSETLTPFSLYSYILGPLGGRKKWQAQLGEDVIDSLDEFLNICLCFQEAHTPSLQGLLHWLSQEVVELKRDLEQSNQVRVMTVHGSKGLQAPIILLADTTQPPIDLPSFALHEGTLLWLPPAGRDTSLTLSLKDSLRDAQQEEYWRLLYVALTRAADALYICGWEGSAQETWYSRVNEAMQTIGTLRGENWILSSLGSQEIEPEEKLKPPPFLLPQWLRTAPPLEKQVPILRPSAGYVPLSHGTVLGRERGILIHKLLEFLPLVPSPRRRQAALRFLENAEISHDNAQNIINAVEKVFALYPEIFGPSSQGEVPFTGYLGDSLLSGQMDRLIVEDEAVLIVDYKTHENVPETFSDIPLSYLRQMGIYRIALQHIYPDKTITCALLWTEIPRLDVLPFSLMESAMENETFSSFSPHPSLWGDLPHERRG